MLYSHLTCVPTEPHYTTKSVIEAGTSVTSCIAQTRRKREVERKERKKSPHHSPLPISHCSMTRHIREVEIVRLCMLKLAQTQTADTIFGTVCKSVCW